MRLGGADDGDERPHEQEIDKSVRRAATFVMNRDTIKRMLGQTGLFPVARATYRRLNPKIRAEHQRGLQLYSEVLKRGGLCFDIGANLGERSEIFVQLGNRVLIVEPNPECSPTLKFLFGKRNAEIVTAAVGSSEGVMQFFSHGTDGTASALPNSRPN